MRFNGTTIQSGDSCRVMPQNCWTLCYPSAHLSICLSVYLSSYQYMGWFHSGSSSSWPVWFLGLQACPTLVEPHVSICLLLDQLGYGGHEPHCRFPFFVVRVLDAPWSWCVLCLCRWASFASPVCWTPWVASALRSSKSPSAVWWWPTLVPV